MDTEKAIRSRRTHKRFGADPVPREVVDELLELACWAPNHHLTEPWRFRVLGPESLARLAATGKPGELEKLSRAPTLVVASAKLTGDDHQNHEDVLATACASYIVLLAAHARGLASYWRTPRVLQSREGQAAIGMGEDEEFVALIHLGPRIDDPTPKERAGDYVEFLD
ncbi:MAG TPA: nitroreductase [Gaiellaceae bacterium]